MGNPSSEIMWHKKVTCSSQESHLIWHNADCPSLNNCKEERMSAVLFSFFRINEYVVNKYHHKLIQIGLENFILKCHKCSWGISHSEWHNQELVMTVLVTQNIFRLYS